MDPAEVRVEPADLDEAERLLPGPGAKSGGELQHPPNFHCWAIVTATASGASLGSGVLRLALSILVVLVQVFVLGLMIRESDNARCLGHEGCPSGTWCGGVGDLAGGAGKSGACFDCYYVTADTQWARTHTSTDFEEARAHCARHDLYPDRCDYIVRSSERATGCSLFIVLFVAVLVPLPIINDADEVAADNQILVHRLETMESATRQWVLYALAWTVLVLRKWLLPAMLVGAAVAQTLTNPMTVQQILLNGLCVCFIMEVDVVLWHYIIPRSQEQVIQVMQTATPTEPPPTPHGAIKHFGPFWSQDHIMIRREPWLLSRAYAFSLSLLMVALCYSPFSFSHESFFFVRRVSTPEFPMAPHKMGLCDKISAVCSTTVLFSLVAAFTVGIVQMFQSIQRRYRCQKPDRWALEIGIGLASLLVRILVLCATFLPLSWAADALYNTGFVSDDVDLDKYR